MKEKKAKNNGIRMMLPQRCSHLNFQNLWMCYVTWQCRKKVTNQLWDGEIVLDYLNRLNVITSVLMNGRGKQKKENQSTAIWEVLGLKLPTLKMESVTWEASKARRNRHSFSPRASRKECRPVNSLILSHFRFLNYRTVR